MRHLLVVFLRVFLLVLLPMVVVPTTMGPAAAGSLPAQGDQPVHDLLLSDAAAMRSSASTPDDATSTSRGQLGHARLVFTDRQPAGQPDHDGPPPWSAVTETAPYPAALISRPLPEATGLAAPLLPGMWDGRAPPSDGQARLFCPSGAASKAAGSGGLLCLALDGSALPL